ncbi:MAG: transporter [Phycisphaerales bacterium]|nr:MAG: transporter [Phycisphaerales bacterium]
MQFKKTMMLVNSMILPAICLSSGLSPEAAAEEAAITALPGLVEGVYENRDAETWQNDLDERLPRVLAPEPTPFTIEPGRLAIEVDLINYAYDRHNPDRANERVHAFEWPITFRYGLLDHLELQFGMEAYVRESVRDRDAGTRETTDGFGDLIIGAKYNLWGNDDWDQDIEGATALAVLPFLRLPTNRHGLGSRAVEGGVLVPFAIEDFAGFEIEWTPGFAAVRNSDDDGYVFEWSSLLVFNRGIVEGLDWFAEFESTINSESGEPWIGHVGGGLTWELTDDTVLEGGVTFGVTRSADDFGAFITLVQRF